MSSEHDDDGDRRFLAIYEGTVAARNDPERLGRVKVRVPGLLEPESGWALPCAMPGAGPGIGFYMIPPVGAEVVVWFVQGDPDRPRYAAGNWTRRGGAPGPVRDASAEEAPLIAILETEKFRLLIDERPTSPGFEIKDKQLGNGVTYDGLTGSLELKATTLVKIESLGAVSIDGLAVTIKNRPVNPAGGPI